MTANESRIVTGEEPHPSIPLLDKETLAKLDEKLRAEYITGRREMILLTQTDPINYGYEPDIWRIADEQQKVLREKYPVGVIEELDLGGNRASKSERAAKRMMQLLRDTPGARVWCLQSKEDISRIAQQSLFWKYMPLPWKSESGKLKQGVTTKIAYSVATGFTDNNFVCPNGSQCAFKFYSVDVTTVEGPELDAAWCFTGDTRVTTPFGPVPIQDLRPGDLVTTRFGKRTVIANTKRVAPVGSIRFSNGSQLTGTADHPVLTTAHGWTRLAELKLGQQCVVLASNLTVKCITAAAAHRSITNVAASYTATSTRANMDRSRPASSFITSTTTNTTMPLQICNAFRPKNTCGYITNLGKCRKPTLEPNYNLSVASIVESGLCVKTSRKTQLVVAVSGGSRRINVKPIASVESAGESSQAEGETSVASVVSTWAAVGKAEVFNLRVAGAREYVANGIVVHNCDELVPPSWLEFLRYRLVTRNGLLLTTFTPVEGYSPTVAEYLRDAITLQEIEADPDLLPLKNPEGDVTGGEKVPRLQQSGNPRARIVYFNTHDNPFGNPQSMKQTLTGKSRVTILMRFYGVPTKASATVFVMFKETVHVISPEKFAAIEKLNGTRFHLVDPCSGRNWFMIWMFIDALHRKFIYREWPSYGHPAAYIPGIGELGPWTVPGKADDGERGPGQRELGWGLKRYIEEIERLETLPVAVPAAPRPLGSVMTNREEIFERWIDARYANARTVSTEQSTTLIEQLDDLDMSFMASKSEKQIFSGSESGSIRLISDALYYDESKPIDHLNQPHLYVLSTCPNTIYSLLNWTGRDGQHGACKDPIDTLRMAELSDINYCDPAALKVRAPFAQSRRAAA